jgi:hypothetical protein
VTQCTILREKKLKGDKRKKVAEESGYEINDFSLNFGGLSHWQT